jgi:hypothetical protein
VIDLEVLSHIKYVAKYHNSVRILVQINPMRKALLGGIHLHYSELIRDRLLEHSRGEVKKQCGLVCRIARYTERSLCEPLDAIVNPR